MHKPTLDWLHEKGILEVVMTAMRGPDRKWDECPMKDCDLNWYTIKRVTTGVLRWAVGFTHGTVVSGSLWCKGLPHDRFELLDKRLLNWEHSYHFLSHVMDAVGALKAHGYYLPNRIPLTAYLDPKEADRVGFSIVDRIGNRLIGMEGKTKDDFEALDILYKITKKFHEDPPVELSL